MIFSNQIELTEFISEAILDELKNQIDKCDGIVKYKLASTYRMFKAWNHCLTNEVYKPDFECAARDYLIVNNAILKVSGYTLSAYADRFGLVFDELQDVLSANHKYPQYINSLFLNSCFMQGVQDEQTIKDVNLETNSFIRNISGFTTYKSDEQKVAVLGALKAPDGYTTLISMSTGGGKSLVTQAVSYQKEGLTVIIVPTVSLMIDQVRNINCKSKNEVLYYNASSNNLSQIEEAINNHTLRMLFISPEALIRNKRLYGLILNANDARYLKNLVIDEAHMVMEWGALFRVDFQCLDIVRKEFLNKNPALRTYLLSATFCEEVVKLLKLTYSENEKWLEIRCDKLRKEPRFSLIKTSGYEKADKVVELICTLPHPMIVYVQTPEQAEILKRQLFSQTGMGKIRTFTGRTGSNERSDLIDEWTNDDFSIMIATCAFGVGVDKKDVRTVLHVYVPENPNNYYQEAGRGGRDGLPCLSVVLYSNDDIDQAFYYIQKVLTTEKLVGRWFSMLKYSKPKGAGKFIIDTTVKPSYHNEDSFEFWPNDGDVIWNVYVILFLKRQGLLKVDSMQYDDSTKYTFEITILKNEIRTHNEKSVGILDQYRQKEFNHNLELFKEMRAALINSQKKCIAALFNQVYGRTDEFCAGCDAHDEVHNYQSNKVFETSLNMQLNEVSANIQHILYGSTNELIIAESSLQVVINLLAKLGINAFVGPLDLKYFCEECNYNTTILGFGYKELFEYAGNGRMFLSGCVGVILPIFNSGLLIRVLSICKQLNLRYHISFIFLAEDNVFVPEKNKKLAELIEGPCIQSYDFEEECKNV